MSISSAQSSMAALNKIYALNNGRKMDGDGLASYLRLNSSKTGSEDSFNNYQAIWDQLIDDDNIEGNTLSLERFYANGNKITFQSLDSDLFCYNTSSEILEKLSEEQFIASVSGKNPFTSDLFLGNDSYLIKNYILGIKEETEELEDGKITSERMDLLNGTDRSQFNKIIFEYGANNNNKVDFAKIFSKESNILFNNASESGKQEMFIHQGDKIFMATCDQNNPSSVQLKEVSGLGVMDQNMLNKGYEAVNFKIADGWLIYDVVDSFNKIISKGLICDDLSEVPVETKDISPLKGGLSVVDLSKPQGDDVVSGNPDPEPDDTGGQTNPDDDVVSGNPDPEPDNTGGQTNPDDDVVSGNPDPEPDNTGGQTGPDDKKDNMGTGEALNIIEKNFSTFEKLDSPKDGVMNYGDLSKAALDSSLSKYHQQAAFHFLSNPSVLEKLDNAGDKYNKSDGNIHESDIREFRTKYPELVGKDNPTGNYGKPGLSSGRMSIGQALDLIKKHFVSIERTQGGKVDQMINIDELTLFSQDESFPVEARQAAAHLLENRPLLNSLDIAGDSKKNVDGVISRLDIREFERKNSSLLRKTFTKPVVSGSGNSDQSTPKAQSMTTGEALNIIDRNFALIDTIDGSKRDDRMTTGGLIKVSQDKSLPEDLRDAALYFLNNKSILDKLDNVNSGGQNDSNGKMHRNAIAKFKATYPELLDTTGDDSSASSSKYSSTYSGDVSGNMFSSNSDSASKTKTMSESLKDVNDNLRDLFSSKGGNKERRNEINVTLRDMNDYLKDLYSRSKDDDTRDDIKDVREDIDDIIDDIYDEDDLDDILDDIKDVREDIDDIIDDL